MEHNTSIVSLDMMHDIIVPPAISFWPLAPGWYAFVLLVLAYGFHIALKLWAKYRADAYRREALRELVSLVEKEKNLEIKRLLILMKRVALQNFARESVASLSDSRWWEFVEKYSQVKIDTQLRNLSQKVLYSSGMRVSEENIMAMTGITKLWIETHGALDD